MSIHVYTIHHDPDDSIVVELPGGNETLPADNARDWDKVLAEAGYRRVPGAEWTPQPGNSYEYESMVEPVR